VTTDISEKGLETIIMRHMTGEDGLAVMPDTAVAKVAPFGGTGYIAGSAKGFDRAHAIDVPQLFAFLRATQPEAFKKLGMIDPDDPKEINRLKFLTRLSSELGSKRGVIDVLRRGVDHHSAHLNLFHGTPSPGNAKAETLHAQNRFSVTRQLAYSMDETRRALAFACSSTDYPSRRSS
jgi:type I restriction enzyme R subunit